MTLEEFVKTAFAQISHNWKEHVIQDTSLFRPTDLKISCADPSKALNQLGWKALVQGVEVVKKCITPINPSQ